MLPEKAVAFELQAQRDLLALALGNPTQVRAADGADGVAGAYDATGGGSGGAWRILPTTSLTRIPNPRFWSQTPSYDVASNIHQILGDGGGGGALRATYSRGSTKVVVSGGSTSLTSHFVLGVKYKTPCGIVRALLAAAARAGLIPAGAQAQQQAVDSLLREDVVALTAGGDAGGAADSNFDASFDTASFETASCATAAYGDLGLSSPWEKVFNGRGFLVAVGRVSGMCGKRAVVVGRLASAGGTSLVGPGRQCSPRHAKDAKPLKKRGSQLWRMTWRAISVRPWSAGGGGSRVHFVALVLAGRAWQILLATSQDAV